MFPPCDLESCSFHTVYLPYLPKTEARVPSPRLLSGPGHYHLPVRAAFSLVPWPPLPPIHSLHRWNSLEQSQVSPCPAKLPCVLMPFISIPRFTCPSLPPSAPSLSVLYSHHIESLIASEPAKCILHMEFPVLVPSLESTWPAPIQPSRSAQKPLPLQRPPCSPGWHRLLPSQ